MQDLNAMRTDEEVAVKVLQQYGGECLHFRTLCDVAVAPLDQTGDISKAFREQQACTARLPDASHS